MTQACEKKVHDIQRYKNILQDKLYYANKDAKSKTGSRPVQTGLNQFRTENSLGLVRTSPRTAKDHGPNRTAVQSWSLKDAHGPRLVLVLVLTKFGKRPDRTGPRHGRHARGRHAGDLGREGADLQRRWRFVGQHHAGRRADLHDHRDELGQRAAHGRRRQ